MVDVELRRKLAYDLRRVGLGRMSFMEFTDIWELPQEVTPDPVIGEVVRFTWVGDAMAAENFAAPRSRGERLRPSPELVELRQKLARVLVFLYTDLPYEWHDAMPRFEHGLTPTKFGLGLVAAVECVLGSWLFVTLGAAKIAFGIVAYIRRLRQYNRKPEVRELIARREAYWPFMHENDLVEALSRPRLLAGSQQSIAI